MFKLTLKQNFSGPVNLKYCIEMKWNAFSITSKTIETKNPPDELKCKHGEQPQLQLLLVLTIHDLQVQ